MVKFNSEKHIYTNFENEKYISCSTIVGLYEEEFKTEFQLWCSALKILDPDYEKNKPVYRALLMEDWIKTVIPNYINIKKLIETKEELRRSWTKTNVDACADGTAIHEIKENNALSSKKAIINDKEVDVLDWQNIVVNKSNINYYKDLPDGYYTELRLWNHDFKIAGTLDAVLIETNEIGERWVTINDWKTNKEFSTYNKYKKYLLTPLKHLQECHKNIYTMQISLYAYLLECMGFKVKFLMLTHIDKKTLKHTYHELTYRRQDVINMIEHYHENKHITKKQKEEIEYEELKAKYVALINDDEDYSKWHLFNIVKKHLKVK